MSIFSEIMRPLRVLQFNTLARCLAETIYFPYAIDLEQERRAGREHIYESWEAYGITERHWQHAELVKGGTPAEYLLGQNEAGTFGVEEANGKYLYAWGDRLPLLIAQITQHDPDLIFLQEVQVDTVPEFATALRAQIRTLELSCVASPPFEEGVGPVYDGLYAARRDAPESDGIAILWKRTSFDAPSDARGELLRYSDGQKLALLQPLVAREAGVSFLAVTTHLHWNPVPRPGGATLQEVEATELIQKVNGREPLLPVVLGADLNCGVQNAAFRKLASAGFEDLDARLPADQRKRFSTHVPRAAVPKLTDARRWDQPAVTVNHPCLSDYILVRDLGALVEGLAALDTGVQGFTPGTTNGLPNKNHSGSDHFPIGYNIALTRDDH